MPRIVTIALVLLLSLGVGAAGCKKKEGDKDKPKGEMTADMAGEMTADMAAIDRPAPRRRPTEPAKIEDADLKKVLTEKLGPKAQKELDAIKKELADARKAFDVSDKGKALYKQFEMVVENLRMIGEEARKGRFERISSLAMTGYVMGLMAVYQLKDVAVDLAKKAAAAAKKLKIGAAKKLGAQGKAMLGLVKVVKTLNDRYTETLKPLLGSKSSQMRLATVKALVKAYPAAPKTAKPLLKGFLTRTIEAEKDAPTKAEMQKLAKGL